MKKLIAACATFLTMGAQAHFIDGNQLLTNIESQTPAERTFAIGFVTGVVDAARNKIICVPDRVTIKQVVDISKAHLQQNPSIRHKPAAYIVSRRSPMSGPAGQKPRRHLASGLCEGERLANPGRFQRSF